MSALDLSVCIATYNRARFLRATLDSILSQLPQGAEVILVDGASPDDTPAIAADIQKRDTRLRYVRQEVNGGVDRDFATAVALARGRYCWLFSDDDCLKEGAIEKVMRHLGEGHSLILVNAEVRNHDLSRVIDPNRLKIENDRVYPPGSDERLFVDAGGYLTFIGGVVISREVWESRAKEPYFGSLFIHFGVIFQKPLPATTLVIAEPLIEIRYGNAMWTGRSFEIWMFKWPDLVWSMPFPDRAKRQVVAREPWRNPALLLIFRATGAYGPDECRKYLDGRAGALYRAMARLIAVVPAMLVNAAAVLAVAVLKPRGSTTAIDLRQSRHFVGRLWRRS
jgi:glycosyltransferase involved in cell wall biosynthesis